MIMIYFHTSIEAYIYALSLAMYNHPTFKPMKKETERLMKKETERLKKENNWLIGKDEITIDDVYLPFIFKKFYIKYMSRYMAKLKVKKQPWRCL